MRFQDSFACRSATGIPGRIAGGASGAQGPDAAAADCRKVQRFPAREAVSRSFEKSPPPPRTSRMARDLKREGVPAGLGRWSRQHVSTMCRRVLMGRWQRLTGAGRSRHGRVLLLLTAWLAGPILALGSGLLLPAMAQAQSPQTLVSNSSQSQTGISGFDYQVQA